MLYHTSLTHFISTLTVRTIQIWSTITINSTYSASAVPSNTMIYSANQEIKMSYVFH